MRKDTILIRRATEIALKGIDEGGGPFGALIARKGKIISEAYNKVVMTSDPTAHAEILAIRQAAQILGSHDLDECVLYSSCEPCPMCLGAIYWARIKKVVYSCNRTDASKAGFSDNFIYEEILTDPADRVVTFLTLENEGGEEVFNKWIRTENKIPY